MPSNRDIGVSIGANTAPSAPGSAGAATTDKWKAFTAIAISFVTMVFSMSMVFVALSAMADDFGVTLRAISWVVIVQSLVISALMMPMGRIADIVGRRKVHLVGLALFAVGSLCVALAPTFKLMIAARVLMSAGNAMGQAVGTAMIVAVFPPEERGKALGSQTSVVAIGAAMGPIGAGFVLQALPWRALFFMLIPPLLIAFIAGYRYLDEAVVSSSGGKSGQPRPGFDWGGATLSALLITTLVLTVSNPWAVPWTSPLVLAGCATMAALLAAFILWELRHKSPMLQLRFFARRTFTLSVLSRTLGFVGYTAVSFLMPILLISVRGLKEATTGAVLFLASLGMGLAGHQAGRHADNIGERPLFMGGFILQMVTMAGLVFVGQETPLWIVMLALFISGVAFGFWNVPNSSVILGSVPSEHLGVVGAFMNLTRNIGNVLGQALASAIVVGVMAARGFDLPLSKIGSTVGASAAFLSGWRTAFILVTLFSLAALVCAWLTHADGEAGELAVPTGAATAERH